MQGRGRHTLRTSSQGGTDQQQNAPLSGPSCRGTAGCRCPCVRPALLSSRGHLHGGGGAPGGRAGTAVEGQADGRPCPPPAPMSRLKCSAPLCSADLGSTAGMVRAGRLRPRQPRTQTTVGSAAGAAACSPFPSLPPSLPPPAALNATQKRQSSQGTHRSCDAGRRSPNRSRTQQSRFAPQRACPAAAAAPPAAG